jgi:hypothetical protein
MTAGRLKVGVVLPTYRRLASPENIRRAATLSESLGFDSVWVTDHVVVPSASLDAFGPAFYEGMAVMSYVAGITSRVQIGAAILIVPYRHPLVLAKMLATADQLSAVSGRIGLAKLDAPKGALPDPLLQSVRDQVARADRETTDPYARQAVISAAADALSDADLMRASDALLEAELKRSHSPYYFMLDLAANAKKRGDKTAALDWEQKAYAAADGPATRLQWGVHYVRALIELAPQDEARIEQAAKSVIGELDPTPDTFYERNRRGLERMGEKLEAWNARHQHNAAVARIRAQMSVVCGKLPTADPARPICDGVMRHSTAANA